jgi:hypothetical protein
MRRFTCAALLTAVCAGLLFAAPTDATRSDAHATLSYLKAYDRFLRDSRAGLPGARVSADAYVKQVATGCPNVLANAPRGKALERLVSEAFTGLVVAFIRPLEPRVIALAAAVEKLRWGNRELTRLVSLAAARARAGAAVSPPPLCSDLLTWARSAYKDLPATTTAFLTNAKGLLEEPTIHGRSLEGQIEHLLVRYEGPSAKRAARSLKVDRRRLQRAVNSTTREPTQNLIRALGLKSLFALSGKPATEFIAPPPAVRKASGRELEEFKRGEAVVAQTGCLACHRIGSAGHRRPGPDLTYVGSRLSERQIERVLLKPKAPMPSFRGLPKAKLKAVVKFLSLLRR